MRQGRAEYRVHMEFSPVFISTDYVYSQGLFRNKPLRPGGSIPRNLPTGLYQIGSMRDASCEDTRV